MFNPIGDEGGHDSFTFVLTPEILLDVEHNPLFNFLQSAITSNDRANLNRLCQKVSFTVHGYDADPRELYEVREFILFCRALSLAFPFFFYFLPRPLSMLVVMGALEGKPISETHLVDGSPVVQKMCQMDPEKLDKFTRKCAEEAVKFGMKMGHHGEKEMRDLFFNPTNDLEQCKA